MAEGNGMRQSSYKASAVGPAPGLGGPPSLSETGAQKVALVAGPEGDPTSNGQKADHKEQCSNKGEIAEEGQIDQRPAVNMAFDLNPNSACLSEA